MDTAKWLEAEFNALRTEILALGEAERDAVKFYVPAASVVYAVPYYLLEHLSPASVAEQHRTFLWTFSATAAGMLVLAMLQSLYWSVDGARRLGMYIMNAIEPRTHGGLRWEWTLFQLHQKRQKWPSDSLTIAVASVLANLVAAYAAANVFIQGFAQLWPVVIASAFAAASLPSIRRIDASSGTRREYAERITALMTQYPEAESGFAQSMATRTVPPPQAPDEPTSLRPRFRSRRAGERS